MKFKERFIQQRQDFAELMKHYPFTTETLTGEEWKTIDGFNGKYQISNYGRVKSFGQRHCILKPKLNGSGYLTCVLYSQGKPKPCAVHRLVAKAFIPNPNNKREVNHVDGIKWNSCVSNLEWTTHSGNAKHAYDTGLHIAPKGKKAHNAKLTSDQVLYIRENPDGLSSKQLAENFGIVKEAICNIQRGKTYQSIGGKIRGKKEKTFHKLSPEIHEKIYTLYQTGKYSQTQIGKMFGADQSTVSDIIKRIDKQNGRAECYKFCWPDDVREKIRAEYRKGVVGCGCKVLAKKYGCAPATILRIVNEK